MTLRGTIRDAALQNDVDDAARVIQSALGVKDGLVAHVVLDDAVRTSWRYMAFAQRRQRLCDYASTEIRNMG